MRVTWLVLLCLTCSPGLLAAVQIRIDWPSELTVSCDAEKPGRTDVVVSVGGLEDDKAYSLKLEGFYRGPRYIAPRRLREPSFLYKDVPPGEYHILVKDDSRERTLVGKTTFRIKSPEPILVAPASVPTNTPIRISLSNVVGPDVRGTLYLTIVPAYYPLNTRGQQKNLSTCEVVEFEFKGLPAGNYELRLLQSSASDDPLLARRAIAVGGHSNGSVASIRSSQSVNNEQQGPYTEIESANTTPSLPAGTSLLSTEETAVEAAESTTNFTGAREPNLNQRGIVRDLLAAYDDNLDRLNIVAENADYAALAWAAYADDPAAIDLAEQRGWAPMKSIVIDSSVSGDTVATVFLSVTGETVVAFRGTDFQNKGDIVTDIWGSVDVTPLTTGQLEGARVLAREYPDAIYVGHSLGGRLAQIAHLETGGKAVGFNSAPLGAYELTRFPTVSRQLSEDLIRFRSPDDPVTWLTSTEERDQIEVSNVYTGGGHSIETIARAMQDVRIARDEGWIDVDQASN